MENKFLNLDILGYFSVGVNMSNGNPKYKINYNLTNSSMPLIVTESPLNSDGIFGLKGKCQYDMYFYIDTLNRLRYVDIDGKDYLFEETDVENIYVCKELSLSAIKDDDIKIIVNDNIYTFKLSDEKYLLKEVSSGSNMLKIEHYETGGIERIVKQSKINETTIDLEELIIAPNEEETALCVYYKKKGQLLTTTEVGGYYTDINSVKQYTESGGKNIFEYSIYRTSTWLLFKDVKNDRIQESLVLDAFSNIIEYIDAFNKVTTFTRTSGLGTVTKYNGETLQYHFRNDNVLTYVKNEYDEIQTYAYTPNDRLQSTCVFSLKHLNHFGKPYEVEDRWTNVANRSYPINLVCPFEGKLKEGRELVFYGDLENPYTYREEIPVPGKREQVNSLLLFIKGNGVFQTCATMKLRVDYFDNDDNLLESSEDIVIYNYGEDKFYYFSSYSHFDYAYYEVAITAIYGLSSASILLYHFNGGIGTTYRYDKYGKVYEVINGNNIKKLNQSIFGKGIYTGATVIFHAEDFSQYETKDCLGNETVLVKDYLSGENSIQLSETRRSLYDNKVVGIMQTDYKVNTLDPVEIKDDIEKTSVKITYDEKNREKERCYYEGETLKSRVLNEYNDKNAFYPDSLKSQEVFFEASTNVGKNTIDVSDNQNDTFLLTTIKNNDTVTLKTKSDKYGRISEISLNDYVVDDVEYDEDNPYLPRRINNEYFIYDEKGRLIKKARGVEDNFVERIDYNEEGQINKIAKIETDDDGEEYEIYYKNIAYKEGIIKKETHVDCYGEVENSVTYSLDAHYNFKGQEVECNGSKGYVEYSSQICEIADNNELYCYISTHDKLTYTCLFEEKLAYNYATDENDEDMNEKGFTLCNETFTHEIEMSGTIEQLQRIDGFSCVDVSSSIFSYNNIPVYDMFFYLYSGDTTNNLRIFYMNYLGTHLAIVNNTLRADFEDLATIESNTWYLVRFKLVENSYNIYLNEVLLTSIELNSDDTNMTLTFGGKDSSSNELADNEKNQKVYITCLTVGHELSDEFIKEVQNKFNNLIRIRNGNNTLNYSNLKNSAYIKTQSHIELNDTYDDYISLHNDTVSKNGNDISYALQFDKNQDSKNFKYDDSKESFVLNAGVSYKLPLVTSRTVQVNVRRKAQTSEMKTILSLNNNYITLKSDLTKLYLVTNSSNVSSSYALGSEWRTITFSWSKQVKSDSIETYPYLVKVYVDGDLVINTTVQLKYDFTNEYTPLSLSDMFYYEGLKYSSSIKDGTQNDGYNVFNKYNSSGNIFYKHYSNGKGDIFSDYYSYDYRNRLISESISDEEDLSITIDYKYDSYNRLKSIIRKKNDVVKDSLVVTYDALGRLFRTTHNGETCTYIYDKVGNITLISNKIAFQYDNYNRLRKYGSYNVYYPTSGEILYPNKIETSKGMVNLLWSNRELSKYTNENNVSTMFSYNEEGQRIVKTHNGNRYDYYYDINGRLVSEKRVVSGVTSTYIYYYDEANRILGYSRNNEIFFYLKDAQGVIYAIIDSVGTIVAEYTYDVFGKVLTSTGGEANNNFIRYKGYYYDVETGYFWLSSRYYSPELCRFIQPADVSTLNPHSINGLNIFSYGRNNPVIYSYSSLESSIMMFGKGHQGNMKVTKYAYWTTEELFARLKELSRKGHLTAEEKKEKKEIETELKARRERNKAKRKGYAHSHFSLSQITSTVTSTPSIVGSDTIFESIPNINVNINVDEEALVATGALVVVGGLITYVIANDATGFGVADDWALIALIPLFILLGGEL